MLANISRRWFSRANRLIQNRHVVRDFTPYPPVEKRVEPVAEQNDVNIRRLELTPHQQWLISSKAMERPFTGHLWSEKEMGYYNCSVCNTRVFSWDHKYFPSTGVASFWAHVPGKIRKVDEQVQLEDVNYTRQSKGQIRHQRVECKTCGSHLGAVFFDGPAPTHLRYSINSATIEFKKVGEFPDPNIAKKAARLQAESKKFVPIK